MTEPAPDSTLTPTPPPPELVPVQAAFDAGDVRSARAAARALTSHPAPEVATGARDFLARTDSDPMALAAALTALGVLALVSSAYLF